MPFERVVGIYVTDDDQYQKYREGMLPLLGLVGGSFGFDFRVSEVLLSKTDDDINRVFTIEFPSQKVMEEFFSSPEYLEVQAKYFNSSVKSKTLISLHEKIA